VIIYRHNIPVTSLKEFADKHNIELEEDALKDGQLYLSGSICLPASSNNECVEVTLVSENYRKVN